MAVNYERVGKRIQELRKLKKMSQADLAEQTGMSVSYISHIETGIKHASLESVVSWLLYELARIPRSVTAIDARNKGYFGI